MKKRVISLTVNDTRHDVLVNPNRTLLELLREDIGLTGTKFGCELGECGVCTVLIDDTPALACITLAAVCDGRRVTTVEGVDESSFEIIERAFREEGASQCGYCTPAFVLMFHHHVSRGEVSDARAALSGNICRCTGFTRIIKAYERSLELASE